jgi:hypothetical protein
MKRLASAKRKHVSRAQILVVRRRLAFLRQLERRLKLQTAILESFNPMIGHRT